MNRSPSPAGPLRVRQQCAIVALSQVFVAEVLGKQFLDQLRHRPATGAVSHVDLAGLEVEGTDVGFAGLGRGVVICEMLFSRLRAPLLFLCFARK